MLAPAEVTPAALPRRLLGYDREQVDSLVAGLRAGYESAWADRAGLAQALARLESEAAEVTALERDLRETLVGAQRTVEERRRQAEAKGAALLAQAQSRAEESDVALAAERARVEAEIERLRELERVFRSQAKALVEDALALLGGLEASPGPAEHEPEPPRAVELAAAAPPSIEDDTLSFSPPAELVGAEPSPETVESLPAELEPLPPEPEPAAPLAVPSAAVPLAARTRGRPLALSLGILAVGALIAVGIWQLASDGEAARATPAPPIAAAATAPPVEAEVAAPVTAAPAAESVAEPRPAQPSRVRLALRAAGGDAWVLVRAGSARGKLLFEGFLYDGESRRFAGRRLWMRVGDPTHLVARLGGKPVRNLPAGTADLVVTPAGVRTVALG